VFFIQKDWGSAFGKTKSMPSSLPRLFRNMRPRDRSKSVFAISIIIFFEPIFAVVFLNSDEWAKEASKNKVQSVQNKSIFI
jgi:hypothetical protein